MMQRKSNQLFLAQLTGLRFIAAFCILFTHLSVWTLPFKTVPGWYFGFDVSALGMTLFFVLSGVVIHLNYSSPFSRQAFSSAFIDLLVARFARLFPLYLFFIFFAVFRSFRLVDPFLNDAKYHDALLVHLLALQSWTPYAVDGVLQMNWEFHVSWSISTELFFYLAYPFFGIHIARIRRPRTAFLAMTGWMLAAFAILYALYSTQQLWGPLGEQLTPGSKPGNGFVRWLTYVSPYIRILEFVMGCLVAQTLITLRDRPLSGPEVRFGGRLTGVLALGVAAILGAKGFLGAKYPYLGTYPKFCVRGWVGHSFSSMMP